MNVMLISQCSKQALVETRRVVDQFAERKGERTWQTSITLEGLHTLRKLLGKTAKRNTAVACHWIKKSNTTELLWIVGNAGKFNEQGSTPTNTTERDILRSKDENLWHTIEDISLLSGLAGLFHDFGKGNSLFQRKLRPGYKGNISEPYRHEWLSLRMFQAFVGDDDDKVWLERLARISADDEKEMFNRLVMDSPQKSGSPFRGGALAKHTLSSAIGWLILSHHRLPKYLDNEEYAREPRLSAIDKWIEDALHPSWNSPQCMTANWSNSEWQTVWEFGNGTPIRSKTWRLKAQKLAGRALKRKGFIDYDWMSDIFTSHMSRMVLMLADHHYSSHDITEGWQDPSFEAYANTDRAKGKLKQKLDEHSIGVAFNAVCMAKSLASLRRNLPAISRHKGFKKRSEDDRFRWQDKAYELACAVRERASLNGFFGVNMASTGCGKTFANGRIMYGLANEKLGCRFSVAIGLRTLTLQTGEAFRKRLKPEDGDLAVLIGSQAVADLHEFNSAMRHVVGSESAEDLLSDEQHVRYEGGIGNTGLSKWLSQTPKLNKLVSAPILVSTIDHLIPATEGERGGKQIAPMLRLFTSDLVLDEPDDFDLGDLPAVCRLVNWAGMLGSRVLVSSATLPPSFTRALFDAYLNGRRAFQKVYGEPVARLSVCCAWFDESKVAQSDHSDLSTFTEAHRDFVDGRVKRLTEKDSIRRKGLIVPMESKKLAPAEAIQLMADRIYGGIYDLHSRHFQTDQKGEHKISIGLVRIANINQLVAVARRLIATSSKQGLQIHFCIYHSRFPLSVRSGIERCLDTLLARHSPEAIWDHELVKNALAAHPGQEHIFVVLASPVAEVGRDHDYDWAIVEPSSMRSLIQLAGRIRRHRSGAVADPNLLILSRNYRALTGSSVAFCKPGFESDQFRLVSHDLEEIINPEILLGINSIPRITESESLNKERSLVDLEHVRLSEILFGPNGHYSARWWQNKPQWCFELQRRTRFRKSAPNMEYVLYFEDEAEEPAFHLVEEDGKLKLRDKDFMRIELEFGNGVSIWGVKNITEITLEIAEHENMGVAEASRKFGTINIPQYGDGAKEGRWLYHPSLGIFHDIKE